MGGLYVSDWKIAANMFYVYIHVQNAYSIGEYTLIVLHD